MNTRPTTEAQRALERRLHQGARRLGLTQGLRQSLWFGFGALWALELGLLLGGPAIPVGALGAAGLLGYAIGRLRRVGPSLAAAVADARLGTGAVSSGAEALHGAHPAFAGAATREALEALEGLPLTRWAPWRAPAGWPLGLLIAGLLPLAWVSQAQAAEAHPSRRLPGLLDPTQVAAAGGGGDAAEPGLVGWVAGGDQAPQTQLAPEVAAVLREELNAGGAPAGGGEGGSGAGAAESSAAEGDGGASSLKRWAEALQAAADAGDAVAQATLRALEAQLGAGAGELYPSDTLQPLAGADPGATIRVDATRRAQVRWELRAAERRYFTRDTGR